MDRTHHRTRAPTLLLGPRLKYGSISRIALVGLRLPRARDRAGPTNATTIDVTMHPVDLLQLETHSLQAISFLASTLQLRTPCSGRVDLHQQRSTTSISGSFLPEYVASELGRWLTTSPFHHQPGKPSCTRAAVTGSTALPCRLPPTPQDPSSLCIKSTQEQEVADG